MTRLALSRSHKPACSSRESRDGRILRNFSISQLGWIRVIRSLAKFQTSQETNRGRAENGLTRIVLGLASCAIGSDPNPSQPGIRLHRRQTEVEPRITPQQNARRQVSDRHRQLRPVLDDSTVATERNARSAPRKVCVFPVTVNVVLDRRSLELLPALRPDRSHRRCRSRAARGCIRRSCS